MRVGRCRESNIAKFPLRLERRPTGIFQAQLRIPQSDNDIVVAMNMPKGRFPGRHGDIPDSHKLVFKFRVMMRLAIDFHRRLRRVRLRSNGSWSEIKQHD